MTTQQLESHIQETSIPAVQSTEITEVDNGQEIVEVKFSHFGNSKPAVLLGYLQSNTLNFSIPLGELSPGDMPPIMPLCWIDAHHEVPFGHYRWDPQSENLSVFGQIPLSLSEDGAELVEWALANIISLFYTGELKVREQISVPRAVNENLISEEEGRQKLQNMQDEARKLLGGASEETDSSSSEYKESGI